MPRILVICSFQASTLFPRLIDIESIERTSNTCSTFGRPWVISPDLDFSYINLSGAHSRLTRTISQQKIKALVSANRDRDRKKRGFCGLWIHQINAIIGKNKKKQYNRYSNLLYNMYKGQLLLNRKIVAQMGILKGNCLLMIVNEIIT
ncbi:hypothetical protein HN51_028933 [Arachis hypogaea]